MDCIFKVESLVDFLAFAFALNTMFSFTKIRRKLFLKLQNDIQDRLDELRPQIEECKKDIDKCISEKKSRENLKERLELNRIYSQAEEKKNNYRKLLQKISDISQIIFVIFAALSAVVLVFSGMKWLTDHYQYTLFLLLPPVLFYIAWILCWGIEIWVLHKIDKDTQSFKVTLETARNIMEEIIPGKH